VSRRAKVSLGPRQADALLDAALRGIEDLRDEGKYDTANKADAALTRLVIAMHKAEGKA
jgi:hypothetical protein